MPKRPSPHPTEAETEILGLLWRLGPMTVGEVQEQLTLRRRTGYTTCLKLLQVMHGKGLVRRDESERAHRYQAAISETRVQAGVVATLVEQLFSGSVAQLVMRAIADTEVSAAERAEIEGLLSAQRKKARKR